MISRTKKSLTEFFPLIRQLSCRLTPILLKTFFTPNQITFLSLLCGLLCAGCFSFGAHNLEVIGAFFLVISYTLDNCDGEIARIKNMSSEFGAKFDDMVDWIVDASFFIALGYGVTQVNEQIFWLWLGIIAALGAFIDYVVDLHYYAKNKEKNDAITREKQATQFKQPQNTLDWLIYIFHKLSRADFCFIVLILALFNLTYILLPFAAIGAQIYWITDLFERARGYRT
jgi:CDP-L-myo-inositol myo-inositolphosphotransferase